MIDCLAPLSAVIGCNWNQDRNAKIFWKITWPFSKEQEAVVGEVCCMNSFFTMTYLLMEKVLFSLKKGRGGAKK